MRENNPLTGLRRRFAETVRVELARHQWSQRKLADATGLSQSYIGRRMTGEKPWTTDDLALIASAMSIPLSSLLPSDADIRVPTASRSAA